MIRLENISVQFGEFFALSSLSCQMNPGDFILILGHNGAGKTTLFDVVSGRVSPTEGKIYRNHQDMTDLSESKRAVFMSRVFQNTHTGSVGQMTVAENLAMATWKARSVGLARAMGSFPQWVVDQHLRPLGLRLEELLHVPMSQLSGGQRQIITIIMSSLCEPDILLLDEPTAALDPVSTDLVLKFVGQFTRSKAKMATLMITHDEPRAKFLANRMWSLDKGHLTVHQ